jgi:hypothetical protein
MSLAELPTELLCLIIGYAQLHGSLGNLSQSNWRIRTHCARYLFHTIKITFSVSGFRCLHELSKSHIAQHVKAIRYEAPELIDPRWLTKYLKIIHTMLIFNQILKHGTISAPAFTHHQSIAETRESSVGTSTAGESHTARYTHTLRS